jgi:hypothetical protein
MGVVALFGFLNRWNDSLATQPEDASAEVADDLLVANGWGIGRHTQAVASSQWPITPP